MNDSFLNEMFCPACASRSLSSSDLPDDVRAGEQGSSAGAFIIISTQGLRAHEVSNRTFPKIMTFYTGGWQTGS